MKPERILVPIDVRKCPAQLVNAVHGFGERLGVTVILLHVVNLNLTMADNRVYEELVREAAGHLDRLAEKHFRPAMRTEARVRVGKPADEIVAAAREENAHLIILPLRRAPLWRRIFDPFSPNGAMKVIRRAPCPVCVVEVGRWFPGAAHRGCAARQNGIDQGQSTTLEGESPALGAPIHELVASHASGRTRPQTGISPLQRIPALDGGRVLRYWFHKILSGYARTRHLSKPG